MLDKKNWLPVVLLISCFGISLQTGGCEGCHVPDPNCLDNDEDGYDGKTDKCPSGRDCDDGNRDVHPLATENCTNNLDDNCNGYTDCDDLVCARDSACSDCVDADGDKHYAESTDCPYSDDCDDTNPFVFGGQIENCTNGIDDDCDELTDCMDLTCFDKPVCRCVDADEDGFQADDGVCPTGDDCDDSDPDVHPADAEGVCDDGKDNDCDGPPDCSDSDCDEDPACDHCQDNDGDTHVGYHPDLCPNGDDCDDSDPDVFTGNPEICDDGKDNDCDENPDCADTDCWEDPHCLACMDLDEDGFDGYSDDCQDGPDCDDSDPDVHPADAEGICGDGKDNDCDELVDCDDDDCTGQEPCVVCVDNDGDNYDGQTDDCPNGPDCDDNNGQIHPDQDEVCDDGVDNDCDSGTPDVFDEDQDGTDCRTDCDDSNPALNEEDADGDGESTCDDPADCDDSDAALNNADADGDGESTCDDPADCDDSDASLNHADADGDGVTTCDPVPDCDDSSASCTDDCSDNNQNGIPDCRDPLIAWMGGEYSDFLSNILPLDDGRMILGGATGSYSGNDSTANWLVAVNPDMTVDFQVQWGTDQADQVVDLLVDPGGNLMVLSQTFGYGNNSANLQITEFNIENGTVVWSRVLETAEEDYPLALTRSGDVYAATTVEMDSIQPRIGFAYDITGDGTQVVRFSGSINIRATALLPGQNGGFLVGGYLDDQALIGTVSSDLGTLTGHTFGARRIMDLYPVGNNRYLTTFITDSQTPGQVEGGVGRYDASQSAFDFAFLMGGTAEFYALERALPRQDGGFWIQGGWMTTDQDGILIGGAGPAGTIDSFWTLDGGGWEVPGSAAIGPDGRLWLTGSSTSFGTGAYDGLLMTGEMPPNCGPTSEFSDYTWTVRTYPTTPIAIHYSESRSFDMRHPAITASSTDAPLTVVCE